ncbi:HNH endonuclease signature motif containing protein [uncultured Amphritea sp.]|uniref:HNH endonuclease n=1 Tax=uncultured Amphritea sp. TaxID=981605 RepID=UPI00261F0C7B|nr:HNH endonuclease signature motif containing protein [uncultured Amphritea sp.]
MPPRIPKACRVRGCSGTSTERHGYCEQHADKAKPWTGGRAGRGRGGRSWRKLREIVKSRANGLCEEHLKRKFVVVGCICDHIIPTAEGGTDDLNNLQLLCQSCSDKKTHEEKLRAIRRSS